MDKNQQAFFELLRAGLWSDIESTDIRNQGGTEPADWEDVYKLAEEQSVIGVVLTGVERLKNVNANLGLNQEQLLQWIGEVQMLEQQNKEMNNFIGVLVEKMQNAGIYTLLVKGQGIAQCYEKPLWRSCGDVDFFLSDDNFKNAKDFLIPLAESVDAENKYERHLGMTIDSWVVELHGSLRCGLSLKIDKELDQIKNDTFCGRSVRSWMNGKTLMFLLGVNNDAIYVFTHFLNHFYKGGVGIRQICDWCRLLWAYRKEIKTETIEKSLRQMGLVNEWKAFGAFAVDYLGMPTEAIPLYSADMKWKRKADMICSFILEVGNMGHNRDMSYFEKYPYLIRKVCSMGRRCGDLIRHARIFPMDSFSFFPYMMLNGVREAVRKKTH
jgi:hypothetical protein